MANHVFISHAAPEDRDLADQIVATLEAKGFPCWIAHRDIPPGSTYAASIFDALKDSQLVVLIFSQHANDSAHVEREIEQATSDDTAILPIRIDTSEQSKSMRYFTSTSHWLDLSDANPANELSKISEAVAALLAAPGAVPAPRPDPGPVSAPSPDASILGLGRRVWRERPYALIGGAVALVVIAAFVIVLLMSGGGGGGPAKGGTSMFRGDIGRSGDLSANLSAFGPTSSSVTELWRFPPADARASDVASTPAVVDGVVYVVIENAVHALYATSGKEKWKQTITTSGITFSSPTVVDGVVYIGDQSGFLYALDAETGKEKWKVDLESEISSSPLVVASNIYVGTSEAFFVVDLLAEGEPTFKKIQHDGEDLGVDSSPAIFRGILYIATRDGNVHAHETSGDNEPLDGPGWPFSAGNVIVSTPAAVDETIYFGSEKSVYAINFLSGERVWDYPTGGQVSSSPAVANGKVFIGSDDNYLYALDAGTGDLKWRKPTGGNVFSSPVVSDGVVYVGSYDGNMYAYKAELGDELWSHPATNVIESSAALYDGLLYFLSWDGSVYALKEN